MQTGVSEFSDFSVIVTFIIIIMSMSQYIHKYRIIITFIKRSELFIRYVHVKSSTK